MKLFSQAESKTQADRIKDIQMYSIRCRSANYCEKFVNRKLIASYSKRKVGQKSEFMQKFPVGYNG